MAGRPTSESRDQGHGLRLRFLRPSQASSRLGLECWRILLDSGARDDSMNGLLNWALGLAMAASLVAAERTNLVFHVQLVRGTDEANPPSEGARPVGEKLATQLLRVFKWKHFWQIRYQRTELAPGTRTKLRLSPEREVEIDLGEPGHRIVTAYSRGKVATRTRSRVEAAATMIGGDYDARSGWFIVVRRDEPSFD